MNDDANNVAPSPVWVRVFRTTICIAVAAAVGWRGYQYEEPAGTSVAPFIMCQLTAAVMAIVGLLTLDTSQERGPA